MKFPFSVVEVSFKHYWNQWRFCDIKVAQVAKAMPT